MSFLGSFDQRHYTPAWGQKTGEVQRLGVVTLVDDPQTLPQGIIRCVRSTFSLGNVALSGAPAWIGSPAPITGDLILVDGQIDLTQNDIYRYSSTGPWVRAMDIELINQLVVVTGPYDYPARRIVMMVSDSPARGTDPIQFAPLTTHQSYWNGASFAPLYGLLVESSDGAVEIGYGVNAGIYHTIDIISHGVGSVRSDDPVGSLNIPAGGFALVLSFANTDMATSAGWATVSTIGYTCVRAHRVRISAYLSFSTPPTWVATTLQLCINVGQTLIQILDDTITAAGTQHVRLQGAYLMDLVADDVVYITIQQVAGGVNPTAPGGRAYVCIDRSIA